MWKRVRSLTIVATLTSLGTTSVFAQALSSEPLAVCFAPNTPQETINLRYSQVIRDRVHTSLTGPVETFQVNDNSRWSSTATDGGGLGQGDPTTLTWSIIPDGTYIPGAVSGEPSAPSNLIFELNSIYGSMDTWLPLFEQVFDRWGNLTGITYVYEASDDGASFPSSRGQLGSRGDVRIGGHWIDGNSNIVGYNYFPNTGDMVLDSEDSFFTNTSSNSLGLRNVLAHEHGHGIGMNHVCPIDQTKLMEPRVSFAFDGPQHDDIRGSNRLYGDFFEDDDTPGTAADLGLIDTPTTHGDLSIDDDSDIDFYAIGLDPGKTIDVTLNPVGFTYDEGPQDGGSCSTSSPPSSINTLLEHNLSLKILDVDGSTVLAEAILNPAGQPEAVSGVVLPSGSGFVEVGGFAPDPAQIYPVQVYDLELTTADLPDFIFGDGFESGDVSAWSSTTP